ncbi:CatB-related O-acetyltransferase [Anaerosacchariphilus polymeriproducens]|uniref:Antibiotic acetyltransferase n=1 Tax=Anaerosacchariphilus polymeriproducens TaxID=1812858 RepID=A0A371AT78_9FIRM|nr:CatB-related O-acetyltransferase [Anaerosacchariphilus polymeriproducens]RDU22742.1 antibiotic acetyltransferase [Anaerosacchariphilus polymeriproducens]
MTKMKLVLKTILLFPIRLFSKISPLALIRNSKIEKKSAILSGTRFYNSSIDNFSYLGRRCFVDHAQIGKFCSIADNCYIGLASHPTSWISTSTTFYAGKNVLRTNFTDKNYAVIKNTIIENDVWIGMNVCILSGIHIGTGAILGAGAVITKDVEPYAIVAGNPAKLIRYRFDESTRELLLKSKWWEKDAKFLKDAANHIENVEQFLSKLNV